MKIWISKNSEVPVREQLIAQITLAIAASDLEAGDKLPSTREIARRFSVHPNTVSSAYQQLVEQKLIRFRKGSGFYIAESAAEHVEVGRRLDELIANLVAEARALGFDESAIIRRLRSLGKRGASARLILVEPDTGLRDILRFELSQSFPDITTASLEELSSGPTQQNVILAAMFDEKPKIESVLKEGQQCVYLKGRSVSMAMSGETRPGADEVIAVLSGWDGFLTFARIMLLAAKVDPGRLVIRSTSDDEWESAARNASIVICDALTAEHLNGRRGVRPFPVISDESIAELRTLLSKSPSQITTLPD